MLDTPARTVTTERISVTMTNSTTDIVEASAPKYARWYYMAVLVVWSALSVAGNALHALKSGAGTLPPTTSAVIATLPPIALTTITHMVILQMRSSSGSWKRLIVPLLLLVSSFALSFTALRELAVMAGFPRLLSPLMAVIIDGPVVAALSALYFDALTRLPKAQTSEAADVEQQVTEQQAVAGLGTRRQGSSAVTADIPVVVEPSRYVGGGDVEGEGGPVVESAAEVVGDGTDTDVCASQPGEPDQAPFGDDGGVPPRQVHPDEIAIAVLVKERANTKASELIVARALMYRDQGYSQEQAAEGVGMHRTTVARWEAVREEILAQQGLAEARA